MKSTNTHIEIDELIATYLSQGLKSEKLSELENWLKASPENQKHFQQMREIWFSTISANEEERYNKEEAYSRFLNRTRQIPQEEKTVKKLSLHKFFYGAAAVALLCLISFASYRTGTEQVKKQFAEMVVEAPLGSKTRLYLPDGTLVWLNAGSVLKYSDKFNERNRKVILSGEAYFEVVQDESHPFVVQTHLGEITVLGTEFNVNAYADTPVCYTTLVHGKVKFSTLNAETITLSPGEQAVVFANSSTKRKVDLEEYVGWVDGMYIFNNRPLGDIMKTFERWYDIQVYYETPNLRDITYSGNLKRYGTINSFLDALELTGDLTYKISGRNILIYDKVEEQEWKR